MHSSPERRFRVVLRALMFLRLSVTHAKDTKTNYSILEK